MKNQYLFLFSLLALLTSCKKGWLEAKSDVKLVVPATLKDLQALLDNNARVFNINQGSMGEMSADNYYLTADELKALNFDIERNAYVWAPDIFQGASSPVWNLQYQQIYYSNQVLEIIQNIPRDPFNAPSWNSIKGSALFYRSFALFNLAQEFCKPYDKNAAGSDIGIPIRLTADINESIQRNSVEQTYGRIIDDLREAKELLPASPLGGFKIRPSRAAVFGMLARCYLSMEDYDKALLYADSCIQIGGTLMNYNDINAVSPLPMYPFKQFNAEVVFHSLLYSYSALLNSRNHVDTALYSSYANNDLRQTLFYYTRTTGKSFRGSYNGSLSLFGGIALDEMYLIKAECNARKGSTVDALGNLNALMITRWKTNTFIPFAANNSNDALKTILNERRKELVFRGLRWTDLRRLNKDPKFAVTLTRKLSATYTLSPSDNRYVMPIPPDEVQLTGISQNPR